jgi:hypothetical protein
LALKFNAFERIGREGDAEDAEDAKKKQPNFEFLIVVLCDLCEIFASSAFKMNFLLQQANQGTINRNE